MKKLIISIIIILILPLLLTSILDKKETKLIEIENTDATTRNFSLTDSNYDGLPLDGNITLTE